MSVSWDTTRAETRAVWTLLHTSPRRLQATLEMIHRYREQSLSLQPFLNGILSLLESSQPVHQVDELALRVLVALDHWVTAVDLWPRWEILLRHYIRVANIHCYHEMVLILTIYLSEIVHQMGRAAEALNIATEGLQRTDHTISPQTTGRLLLKVVWSSLMLNDLARAEDALKTARRLCESLPPASQTILQAYWLCAAADYARRTGHVAEAVRLVRQSLHLFEQDPHAHMSTRATVHRICGVYEWAFGNHHRALKSFKRAERLYRALGDQFGVAWVFGNQALAFRFLGQLQKAETMTKRGIAISKKYGAQWQIVYETGNLVDIYLMMGHLDRSRRVVARHWSMARALKIRNETVRALGSMALVNMHRGRYGVALRALWGDYKYSLNKKRFENLAIALNGLSQCYRKLNHPWRARVLGYAALSVSRRIQSNRLQIMSLRMLAECLPPDKAREALQQALSLTDRASYEQTACEVSLLRYVENQDERRQRWMVLHDRLIEMGLGACLFDRDETHLPDLMICI